MLAGAMEAGTEAAGKGITVIAAKKDIEVQAQSDTLQLASKKDMLIESTSSYLDIASPKKISLSVSGGANITLEGGNIIFQCPGTITVLAGHKSFIGPVKVPYPLPPMPRVSLPPGQYAIHYQFLDKINEQPLAEHRYRIETRDGQVFEGVTDKDGWTELIVTPQAAIAEAWAAEFPTRMDPISRGDPI